MCPAPKPGGAAVDAGKGEVVGTVSGVSIDWVRELERTLEAMERRRALGGATGSGHGRDRLWRVLEGDGEDDDGENGIDDVHAEEGVSAMLSVSLSVKSIVHEEVLVLLFVLSVACVGAGGNSSLTCARGAYCPIIVHRQELTIAVTPSHARWPALPVKH